MVHQPSKRTWLALTRREQGKALSQFVCTRAMGLVFLVAIFSQALSAMELPQIALDGRKMSLTDRSSNGDASELFETSNAEAKAKWHKVGNTLTAVDRMTAVKDKQLMGYRRSQELSEHNARQLRERLWKEVEEKEKLQFRLQEQEEEMDQISGMLKVAQIALAAKENADDSVDGYGETHGEIRDEGTGKKVVTLKVLCNRVHIMRAHQRVTAQVIKDQILRISTTMQSDVQQGIQQLCDFLQATAQSHVHESDDLVQTPAPTSPEVRQPPNGALHSLEPVVLALEKTVVASVHASNDAIQRTGCAIATVQPINEDADHATIDARLDVCTKTLTNLVHVVQQLGLQLQDRLQKLSTRDAKVRFNESRADKSASSRPPSQPAKKEALRIASPLVSSFEFEAPQSPKTWQLVLDTMSKPQEVPLETHKDVPVGSRQRERSPVDNAPSDDEMCYTADASEESLPPRTPSRCSDYFPFDSATQLRTPAAVESTHVERTQTTLSTDRQMNLSKAITLAESALDSLQHDDHTTISSIVNEVQDAIQGNSMKRKKISVAEQVAVLRLKEWVQKRKEAFERRQQMLQECFRLLHSSRPVLHELLPEGHSPPPEDPPSSPREKPSMKIPRPPSMGLQRSANSPTAPARLYIPVTHASDIPHRRGSPTPLSPMAAGPGRPASPGTSMLSVPPVSTWPALRGSTPRSAAGSRTMSGALKTDDSPSKRKPKGRLPRPAAPWDIHVDRLVACSPPRTPAALPNIGGPRQNVK